WRWAFRSPCSTGSRPARTAGPRCSAVACSRMRSKPVVIASPGTLLLAAALASPTIMSAINGDTDLDDAALRFLICVPVAAIMMAVLRTLTSDFGPSLGDRMSATLRRRKDDAPAVEGDLPVRQREPAP